MLRHTRFVNSMPLMPGPHAENNLDPQECFNKALGTMAALNTSSKAKKYSESELRRLREACLLTEAEMLTSTLPFHQKLLAEGHTKQGSESVLTLAIYPDERSDDPGLIYMLPTSKIASTG